MKTSLSFLPLAVIAALYSTASVAVTPYLGTAQNFAVLGGSTVTNAGPTYIFGDVGVAPGSAVTGTESITLKGAYHLADSVSTQAHNDAATAYTTLAGLPISSGANDLTGQELGGKTLTPGVYSFSSGAHLAGTLTLDAKNDRNAVFVFKIASTLITADDAVVNVLNGAANNSVFWQVGTSATIAPNTTFAGNIIADQSIDLAFTAKLQCGRALAVNAAVTMNTNNIAMNCQFRHSHRGRTQAMQ